MPEFMIGFGLSQLTAKNVTHALAVQLMLIAPMR